MGELEANKRETLLEIKYEDVFNAINVLANGEASKVRDIFLTF